MKYSLLSSPRIKFEIPDDWIHEADFVEFRKESALYIPLNVEHRTWTLAIKDFEPPSRVQDNEIIKERLVNVLKAIKNKTALPPIWVEYSSGSDYMYSVHDGQHRLLGSIVAGFTHIPACHVYWRKRRGFRVSIR